MYPSEETAAGVAADVTADEQSYLHAVISSAGMSTATATVRMQACHCLAIEFAIFLQEDA